MGDLQRREYRDLEKVARLPALTDHLPQRWRTTEQLNLAAFIQLAEFKPVHGIESPRS
jgi:hypothetical protein